MKKNNDNMKIRAGNVSTIVAVVMASLLVVGVAVALVAQLLYHNSIQLRQYEPVPAENKLVFSSEGDYYLFFYDDAGKLTEAAKVALCGDHDSAQMVASVYESFLQSTGKEERGTTTVEVRGPNVIMVMDDAYIQDTYGSMGHLELVKAMEELGYTPVV